MSETSEPIISVEGISKRYRLGERLPYKSLRETISNLFRAPFRRLRSQPEHIWALADISFEVSAGEVVGVIGRNGAGKSTLLKILSRITEPSAGRAVIHGRVGSLLEVGTGFHPELTGRENIFLNGAILGMRRSEIEHKFDAIVAFAEVERFIDTPVKRYSSGMYLRLAFSVAAHMEPDILLVDEVLAVGDVAFQKKCLGKMDEVGQQGRTVMVVSHNMPSIVNLCSRAILLSEGRIELEGAADEVVQHYLATARSRGGEVVWPEPESAPGNQLARLHAVRLFQEGSDEPTADVDIAKEICIEISYWCLSENTQLYTSMWLCDKIGSVVLASSNSSSSTIGEDEWYERPFPCGLYRTQCRIPGNFLNDGLYSINALVLKVHNQVLAREDSVLSFFVHDTGVMRGEYFGTWLGAVRPRLAWCTEQLNSSKPSFE